MSSPLHHHTARPTATPAGKFNLREAYERIGFVKTVLSRGRYAESLSDNRSFTEAERDLFDRNAQFAYESFRNKAAESRNMPVEEMQAVAQGRVWTGRQVRVVKRRCARNLLPTVQFRLLVPASKLSASKFQGNVAVVEKTLPRSRHIAYFQHSPHAHPYP